MSRRSRQAQKDRRQADKRAKKEANKAKWAEYAKAGTNQKSKRAKANKKAQAQVKVESHPNGVCGNAGCKKCLQHNLTKYYAKRERLRQEGFLKE